MHQEGLEPSAYRLEGGCSIRLSYWCKAGIICQQTLPGNTWPFSHLTLGALEDVSYSENYRQYV